MAKNQLLAMAEARFFQAVVTDSKGRQRPIIIYACGDDVAWANSFVELFDREKRRAAPEWLRAALANPVGADCYDWCGRKVSGRGSMEMSEHTARVEVEIPAGEDLSEDSIQQG